MTFDLEYTERVIKESDRAQPTLEMAVEEIKRLREENEQLKSALTHKCDQFNRYLLATEDVFKMKNREIARLEYILDDIERRERERQTLIWAGVG